VFRKILLVLLLVAAGLVQAAIPPSLSGSWFEPAHAGHGLSIQVLGDGRAIAYWFVYDRDGAPLHLYIDGRIDDRTIRGDAYAARGMRFGTFDPAALRVPRWGRIEIAFADCANAMLTYDANGEAGTGFGSGARPLVRLSRLDGIPACAGSDLSPHDIGLYSGGYQRLPSQFPVTSGTPLEAAIDTDGLLWAFSTDPPPGPTWVGAIIPPVVVPARSSRGGAGARVFGRVLSNFGFYPWSQAAQPDERGDVGLTFVTRQVGSGGSGGGSQRRLDTINVLSQREATSRLLAGRLDPAMLAGATFHGVTRGQFFEVPVEATFDDDGAVCMRFGVASTDPCAYTGRILVRSTTHRFFDFDLVAAQSGRVFRGRGWVHADGAVATRVVFVGSSDDGVGLGIGMARR
jgi:hypothetical protein